MSDLTAFLSARLDEDEAAAKAATGTAWAWEATGDKDSSWAVGHVESEDGRPLSGEIEHGQGIVIDGVCESINGNLADAAHIARHDPDRALREVAFKRSILGQYRTAAGWSSDNWSLSLRLFAAVWSDHPDYRAEWKP
ncbi:MAG TPA: DUF6221 family protein [Streptosporangiaceae bacterium]|nr:DUF6221 family protein [Streptosporangiaceae bacterium]